MATAGLKFRGSAIVGAGLAAGVIFALFEVVAAAVTEGPGLSFMPLRMIGAMILGPAALEPTYPLGVAALTGVVVHMVLSVAFAFVFAALVSRLALAGMVFGLIIWMINFYGIALLVGWRWFPERGNPIVQFVARVFFFGCPVGWMLARSRFPVVV